MSTTSRTLNFSLRATQTLFAIVVFGLSCTLIKGHKAGTLPSSLGFAAFVGGLAFLGALAGMGANWIRVLQGKAGVVMDAVVAGASVAGGILLAFKIKGISCGKIGDESGGTDWVSNELLCGGMDKAGGTNACHYYEVNKIGAIVGRCKMSSADSAFMFITAIVVAGAAALGWMRLKRGY